MIEKKSGVKRGYRKYAFNVRNVFLGNFAKYRRKNGHYKKLRIAKRTTHEIAVKQRRKNKPEFPNLKWPARIRKKYCNKYQRGQLWI